MRAANWPRSAPPTARRRRPGSTRWPGGTPPALRPVNSPKIVWRRSASRPNRIFMVRIVLFLVLIALAAAGAAWVAEQPGEVALSFGGPKYIVSLPVFALFVGIVIVAALLVLLILIVLW